MSQQPGYTITGTTDAITPISIPTRTTTVVRSLTITEGTWLLNAVANVESTNSTFLSKFIVSFSDNRAKVEGSGFIANLMTGSRFGRCLSQIVQATEPTTIHLEINATFTTSDGELHVNNTDDEYIHFTATFFS